MMKSWILRSMLGLAVTAGLATAGLGLCVHAFEVRRLDRLARPLRVYGTNALMVFVGSGLVGRAIGSLVTVESGGEAVSLKAWFFCEVLLPCAPPKVASLAFALLWVGAWFVVLRACFRRGWSWRV